MLELPMHAVDEFDTKIDGRRRLTLPDTGYEHYHVTAYDDGRIVLEPRELVVPRSISVRTLAMMDRAIDEMDAGNVSAPVDPSDLLVSGRR
ncbi:MAG TPA: hypothetical protein VII66_11190 [Gemmatimonadaceae bacterium]